MKARKDTKFFFIGELILQIRDYSLFLHSRFTGKHMPAVVVKWYTRYFEGVVGASPCEFDSHLPHQNRLQNIPEADFSVMLGDVLLFRLLFPATY